MRVARTRQPGLRKLPDEAVKFSELTGRGGRGRGVVKAESENSKLDYLALEIDI